MKFGLRTPNLKKSLKARTTGRAKRALKKAANPMYGKKGMGFIKNPKRSVKNAIYHRTTVGVGDIVSGTPKARKWIFAFLIILGIALVLLSMR